MFSVPKVAYTRVYPRPVKVPLHGEVHERNAVDRQEGVVPLSYLTLPHHTPGRVVDNPVEEPRLGLILHLHVEPLAVGGAAVDVVDHSLDLPVFADLLLVEVLQLLDGREARLVAQQHVEEVDKKRLRLLTAEEILESEVGVRADVFRVLL